jgi:hypothetical protein
MGIGHGEGVQGSRIMSGAFVNNSNKHKYLGTYIYFNIHAHAKIKV